MIILAQKFLQNASPLKEKSVSASPCLAEKSYKNNVPSRSIPRIQSSYGQQLSTNETTTPISHWYKYQSKKKQQSSSQRFSSVAKKNIKLLVRSSKFRPRLGVFHIWSVWASMFFILFLNFSWYIKSLHLGVPKVYLEPVFSFFLSFWKSWVSMFW